MERDELVSTYVFNVNGSVFMYDNKGTEFFIPAPSFQPQGNHTVALLTNSTHAIHAFNVLNGTLNLWVTYYIEYSERIVKVTLNGTTTDEDAEVEFEFENPKSLPLHNTTTSMQIGLITYDWADLIGTTDFEAYLNRLKIKFNATFFLDPSIVSAVQDTSATTNRFQRSLASSGDYYYAFYNNNSKLLYRYSSDGGSWSDETVVGTCNNGGYFSLWANSTHIDYSLYQIGLRYRRGTFGSNGPISWVTAENIVKNDGSAFPSFIAVDSQGYPYITYSTGSAFKIFKSSLNNGSWANATGYPQTLSSSASAYWEGSLVPLSNSKMYAVFSKASAFADYTKALGRLYNGTGWEPEENASTSVLWSSLGHSIVSKTDDVHLVFMDSTGLDKYVKRTYGVGWGSETTLPFTSTFPVISKASATSRGQLYVFGIVTKTIYWCYYNGSWGGAESITEAININLLSISALYEESNDEVAIIYSTAQAPYVVKFYSVGTLADIPFVDPASGITGVTDEDEGIIIKPPKIVIPTYGYYLMAIGVGLIAVGAIWNKAMAPRTRKARGAKAGGGSGPRGVARGTSARKPRNMKKKRDRKGRFQ